MSNSILENFQKRVDGLSDDELIAMGSINLNQYQNDIVDLIKNEIEKRSIQGEVQEVLFDVFVNGDGFAGRLILLEEQLLFLSIGMKAKLRSSGSGGLIGSIGDADIDKQSAFATQLNFSALENLRSWICHLDEIINCESTSSWFLGNNLTIQVKDEDGQIIQHSVKCDEMPKQEFTELKLKIENTKNRFMQLQK